MEEAFCHFGHVSHSSWSVLQVPPRPTNENEAFEKTLPGAELAGAERSPSALGVAAGTGVAACAGGEDGGFAAFDGRGRGEEDELEARCYGMGC